MTWLRSCPFCGASANIEHSCDGRFYTARVWCSSCPAEITVDKYDSNGNADVELSVITDAVSLWNKRVGDAK